MNIRVFSVFFVAALAAKCREVDGWISFSTKLPKLANQNHLNALIHANGVQKHKQQISWLVNAIQTHHRRDLEKPKKDAVFLDGYLQYLKEELYTEDPEIELDFEGSHWTLIPIIRELLDLSLEKTELNSTIMSKISKLLNFSPSSKQVDSGIISKILELSKLDQKIDINYIEKILNQTLNTSELDHTNVSKLLNLSLGIKEIDCSFMSMRYTIAIIQQFFVSINDFINGDRDSGPNKRYKRTRDYLYHKIAIHLDQCASIIMKNYSFYKAKTQANPGVSPEVIIDELLLTKSGANKDIVELASKKAELSVKPYTSLTKAIKNRKLCEPGILNRANFIDEICIDLSSSLSDSVSFYEIIAALRPSLIATLGPIDKRFHKLREYSRLCNDWIGSRRVLILHKRTIQFAKTTYNIKLLHDDVDVLDL